MNVEIETNNSANQAARFLTWAPTPCRIRLTNTSGAKAPTVTVAVSGQSGSGGGGVVFREGATGAFANQISLTLPVSGVSVPFFIAGEFGKPSSAAGDVTVQASANGAVVGSVPVMVRIRKNANTLTTAERHRLVAAFAQLNNQGRGRFADFREMHTSVALSQAHGAPGFLPWHRAYLLDLERELQTIDPSVALPYWRFDEPAPNIFTRDFLGVSDQIGTVRFSPSNPLQFWRTDGMQGVNRRPLFNTTDAPDGLLTEDETLDLGQQFRMFETMESNPHGSAHTSFGGFISSPATAPRDPLFFLLHCNVDRLWAKWQKRFGRFDPKQKRSFDNNSSSPVGHRLADTMWPWNGVTGGTRPPTAPGGTLAVSPTAGGPGPQPRVQDMLDYRGVTAPANRMGFDYDDVEF
jgi:tyrosinase